MKDLLRFREILKKHKLDKEENAEKISSYLTNNKKGKFNAKDFALEFKIPEQDARIILEVIYKGIEFRKNLINMEN